MPVRPVSLTRALRKGFRDAYDHLGYVVTVSLIAFFLSAIFFTAAAALLRNSPGLPPVVFVLAMLPAALVYYLCAVGVFCYAGRFVARQRPAPLDTWNGIRELLIPALKLFAVDGIITAVLVVDVAVMFIMGSRNLVFLAFAILCLYVLIVWFMMVMYHLPLLVAQASMESGPRARIVIRKSFLLLIDNPGFTVGLFLATICLVVICAAPVLIGLAILSLGTLAFLLTNALHELFVKYDIVEPESEIVADAPWSLPDSWRKRTNSESAQGATDSENVEPLPR